eukprot:g4208.t1
MSEHDNILKRTSLSQIRALQHVVILKDTATVEQVLRSLASHRLVSAPVVKDAPSESSHHGPTWPMNQSPDAVAGFIDVKSLIRKFLEDIKETGILDTGSMLRRMRALEQQGLLFSKKTIKDHGLLSGDGSFLHIDQGSLSLLELASEALLGTTRRWSTHFMHFANHVTFRTESTTDMPNVVHRIAIFDSSSRIVNIISQSDIVRHLLEHQNELGEYGTTSVGELGFGQKEIISVHPEMSAIEALRVMSEKSIGAVAVVNSTGQIIGNFSAADMRTITPEHFGSLALPVGEFLALEHGVEYSGYAVPKRPRSSNISQQSENPGPRRMERGKSVDFLESKSPVGTENDQANLDFAREKGELTRQHPGAEVGQHLCICSMKDSLIEVMALLNAGRVHRVFIVDEDTKPIGVITCTDILRKLVEVYQ